MAITQAICNSFKKEVLDGTHLSSDTYKVALYTSAATLDKTTTAYSATNEVSGTGYSAGGATLAGRTSALTGDVGNLTFTSPTWAAASLTARGALIYNSTQSNKAVCVIDFGSDIVSTNGTFLVTLPASGASALVRFG